MEIEKPNFCTVVSPDEYDLVKSFNQAVAEANNFHKRHHEDLPPPYYTFDYGKLYGLVEFYIKTKQQERKDENI